MTPAVAIARAVLEQHAGVYYVITPESHATREKALNEAARTVEPYLAEYADRLKRDLATNPS
jgi:hypothetical protein